MKYRQSKTIAFFFFLLFYFLSTSVEYLERLRDHYTDAFRFSLRLHSCINIRMKCMQFYRGVFIEIKQAQAFDFVHTLFI